MSVTLFRSVFDNNQLYSKYDGKIEVYKNMNKIKHWVITILCSYQYTVGDRFHI